MNNIPTLLIEGLRDHNIPVPYRTTNSNGFMRWGKSNEYWAREVGDGYVFGDWKQGSKYLIFPNNRSKLTHQEKETLKRIQQEDKQRKLNEAREKAKEGKRIFDSLPNADLNHPYLICKGIRQIPDDIRRFKDSLVIPIYNIYKEIISIQFIDANGKKRFLSGASKKGGYYVIGERIEEYDHLNICEGVATGMSLYEILKEPVIAALDAGNLEDVAKIWRRKCKNQQIRFYSDNDCTSEYNTGVKKTKEAAKAVENAIVLYPMWKDEENKPIAKKVDWNDIYVILDDIELIKRRIEIALIMKSECVKFRYKESKEQAELDIHDDYVEAIKFGNIVKKVIFSRKENKNDR